MHSLSYYYSLVFGSDTQTGSSPAYVWLADQFGHLFIGFGGLFAILWALATLLGRPVPGYALAVDDPDRKAPLSPRFIWAVALIGLALYCGKELRDISMAGGREAHWVEAWSWDVIEDSLTDIAFVAIGIVLALAHFGVFFRIHPFLVFLAALVAVFGLVAYWLDVFDGLGKTNIPYLARMASVNVSPAAPDNGLVPEAESNPGHGLCEAYQKVPAPPLQCTVLSECKKTHFVIYALRDDEIPTPPPPPEAPARNAGEAATGTPSSEDEKRAHFRQAILELRKLGVALIAEHVFRKRTADARFSTLYNFVLSNKTDTQKPDSVAATTVQPDANNPDEEVPPNVLVMDNIERDMTLRLIRSDNGSVNFSINNKLSGLDELFGPTAGDLAKKLAEKTVVWLSLSDQSAVELCTVLAKRADQDGKVVLIRAESPEPKRSERRSNP